MARATAAVTGGTLLATLLLLLFATFGTTAFVTGITVLPEEMVNGVVRIGVRVELGNVIGFATTGALTTDNVVPGSRALAVVGTVDVIFEMVVECRIDCVDGTSVDVEDDGLGILTET